MKSSTLFAIVGILALAISVVCIWFFPSVQDFVAANAMWNGVSQFSRQARASSIDSLTKANLPAKMYS